MSVRKEAEAEKQKLKNMSWKDRAWYVWEYYKFHILALILAAGAVDRGHHDLPPDFYHPAVHSRHQ